MTFRTFLTLKAAVCLVFGGFLLIAPDTLLGLLGATLGAAGRFTAREYGAAMAGTLMLTWLARDVAGADARRAILVDLLVYDAIGVAVTAAVTVTGVLSALGWGIVAVYGFFTLGSAWLLAGARSFASSPSAA